MNRMEALLMALKLMGEVDYVESIGERHALVTFYDRTQMLVKVEEI